MQAYERHGGDPDAIIARHGADADADLPMPEHGSVPFYGTVEDAVHTAAPGVLVEAALASSVGRRFRGRASNPARTTRCA